MPRVGRKAPGGVIYHVLNRANGRQRLFRKPGDYDAFVALLAQTRAAVPGVRLLGYCLMPNHWHLVLWPREDGELSSFMLRLTTAHARRLRAHYHAEDGSGHIYQGRFKSFPVEDDERYLLTLLRYVESNPLRTRPPPARRPGAWRWSSFAARGTAQGKALLDEWPVDVPRDWESLLAEALTDERLAAVRTSVTRGRPFGGEPWVQRTAKRLDLDFTLRPRGRPRKNPDAVKPPKASSQPQRPRRRPPKK